MTLAKTLAGACAALFLLHGCASSAGAQTGRAARADALLQTILERDGGPGVMAAVMRDGEMLWSGAAGLADLESGRALSEDTPMRIGSVSKTITATIALRLAERGLLDLEGDVRTLVPELTAPTAGAITPRLLAAHLAGVRHYDFANYLDANNVYYYPALSDALARTAGDPLAHQPGEAFLYSSLGYNILGVAAERAANASFGELLAREITQPLAMNNTMLDHPLEIVPRRTRFYTRFPDGRVRNTIWRDSSDYYPSGGILSTAHDLARFTDAVFHGDLLSAESHRLVTTEATRNDGARVEYGFGWRIVRDANGNVTRYEHGGETNGAYAFAAYFPATRVSVAGIANANFAEGEPYFFEAISRDLPALFAD
ncbi:MAG: serine hydrolase domain-containing protein [Hyphomonadaceae bacterium]